MDLPCFGFLIKTSTVNHSVLGCEPYGAIQPRFYDASGSLSVPADGGRLKPHMRCGERPGTKSSTPWCTYSSFPCAFVIFCAHTLPEVTCDTVFAVCICGMTGMTQDCPLYFQFFGMTRLGPTQIHGGPAIRFASHFFHCSLRAFAQSSSHAKRSESSEFLQRGPWSTRKWARPDVK